MSDPAAGATPASPSTPSAVSPPDEVATCDAGASPASPANAMVIAAYGRQVLIRDDQGQLWPAALRGRQLDCVVGDRVEAGRVAADQQIVESVEPRRNVVRRSDRFRAKSIAANIDRAAIVLSGEPRFDEALLLRVLLALGAEQIPALLVATKSDLPAAATAIAARLDCYRALGYPVIETSVRSDNRPGLDRLAGQIATGTTLLLGQSGMGKSSLVNALVPGVDQLTAAISRALNSGRHTTTVTRAFALPAGGWLIDSPGFQTFGVEHLSRWELDHAMPEFAPLIGQCRFNDCHHRDEPHCAVRAALDQSRIDPLRYRLYQGLLAQR